MLQNLFCLQANSVFGAIRGLETFAQLLNLESRDQIDASGNVTQVKPMTKCHCPPPLPRGGVFWQEDLTETLHQCREFIILVLVSLGLYENALNEKGGIPVYRRNDLCRAMSTSQR